MFRRKGYAALEVHGGQLQQEADAHQLAHLILTSIAQFRLQHLADHLSEPEATKLKECAGYRTWGSPPSGGYNLAHPLFYGFLNDGEYQQPAAQQIVARAIPDQGGRN